MRRQARPAAASEPDHGDRSGSDSEPGAASLVDEWQQHKLIHGFKISPRPQ